MEIAQFNLKYIFFFKHHSNPQSTKIGSSVGLSQHILGSDTSIKSIITSTVQKTVLIAPKRIKIYGHHIADYGGGAKTIPQI